MLPSLAHFFAYNIKVSLVTGKPFFCKSLKDSKTVASISGFIPFLAPEKDFLFVRHENSLVSIFHP
jgi:hypothetical protein